MTEESRFRPKEMSENCVLIRRVPNNKPGVIIHQATERREGNVGIWQRRKEGSVQSGGQEGRR